MWNLPRFWGYTELCRSHAALSVACKMKHEAILQMKYRKALSGRETLNDRSMGSETSKSETASQRGIDTGRVECLWLYFFLSPFFLLLSRNLRWPVLWKRLILYKNRCNHLWTNEWNWDLLGLTAEQSASFHTTLTELLSLKVPNQLEKCTRHETPTNTSLFRHKCVSFSHFQGSSTDPVLWKWLILYKNRCNHMWTNEWNWDLLGLTAEQSASFHTTLTELLSLKVPNQLEKCTRHETPTNTSLFRHKCVSFSHFQGSSTDPVLWKWLILYKNRCNHMWTNEWNWDLLGLTAEHSAPFHATLTELLSFLTLSGLFNWSTISLPSWNGYRSTQ